MRVTGSSIDPAPYLRYLERKLGDLLGAAVLLVAVTLADGLAECVPLVAKAAAGAGGRENLRLDEERPHQRRPEKNVPEEEGAAHHGSLYRPLGPIGLDLR